MSSVHDDIWGRDPLTSASVKTQHDDAVRASVITRLESGATTLDALSARSRDANKTANELRGAVERAKTAAHEARRAMWKSKDVYWRDVNKADSDVALAQEALAQHERVQRVCWARVRVAKAWVDARAASRDAE